jgi:5'-AMP-activated protein kinase catalytic alpha subunit
MVAGYLPFEDPKTSNLYKKIMAADYQMPKFLSSDCKDFVQKILNTDPETRIRIADIRNHPFMRQTHKEMTSKLREPGLFPGLQAMPYSKDLLQKLIDDYQFEREYSVRCLEANRHNHITATYHLINRKNQRNTYMRETFSTKPNKEDLTSKRERLQS